MLQETLKQAFFFQSWFPTSDGAVNSAMEQQVLDLILATLFVLCHGQRSKLLMTCN